MTDMTAVSAVSATPPERQPSSVEPTRTVSARYLARNMAAVLRDVADRGDSFAIEHFGRVVGFLVPLEGRALVRKAGRISYEPPPPLRDLDETRTTILGILHRKGPSVLDQLVKDRESIGRVAVALCDLERGDLPLVDRSHGWYRLTPEGVRHAEALGL